MPARRPSPRARSAGAGSARARSARARRSRATRRGWAGLFTGLIVLAAALVALHTSAGAGTAATPAGPASPLPTAIPARVAGVAAPTLFAEPDAGMGPVYALLSSARRSLDLTMYELVDDQAVSVLEADAARGVRVRVLLDKRLEGSRNAPAFAALKAHGVQAFWASSRYAATHEKAAVIDGSTLVVMTLNLTSRYYPTSREAVVVDHDPADAVAAEAVFAADIAGRSVTPARGDDLVWSPTQSQADVVALIDSARHSLDLESEELSDKAVVSALVAAARRGVAVRVAMTFQSSWTSGFDQLVAAGARVGVYHGETPIYIHAKLLVVDAGRSDGRALVGSQNISAASLTRDRELGIVLFDPVLIARLQAVVDADVAGAQRWTA